MRFRYIISTLRTAFFLEYDFPTFRRKNIVYLVVYTLHKWTRISDITLYITLLINDDCLVVIDIVVIHLNVTSINLVMLILLCIALSFNEYVYKYLSDAALIVSVSY